MFLGNYCYVKVRAMDPNQLPQQPQQQNIPTPTSEKGNSPQTSTPATNTQAGYEWIANYNNQPEKPPVNNDSFGKRLIFVIFVLVIVVLLCVGTFVMLKQSKKQTNSSNTPSTEQVGENPSQNSDDESKDADTGRKDKLNKLHEQLELYYSAFGYYPSFENVNDPSWLAEYGVVKDEITDPIRGQAIIKRIPTSNYFSYQPKPDNCNNESTKCSHYTIATVLSGAEIYELKSDNN